MAVDSVEIDSDSRAITSTAGPSHSIMLLAIADDRAGATSAESSTTIPPVPTVSLRLRDLLGRALGHEQQTAVDLVDDAALTIEHD